MTHADYHLYATLFDALLAVDMIEQSVATGITLHGKIAGAALRCWGAGRHLDVASQTMTTDVGSQRMSWTNLTVSFGRDREAIVVILDDYIYTPLAEVADLALVEPIATGQEMPF